jgi:putative aldouronate transport system substrate-binding protein
MKKLISMALLVFAFVGLIAMTGCGGNDGEGAGIDGLDENGRFIETQQISVVIWDRTHERMPDMADNGWTQWLQERALRDLNIDVEFVVVPRWDQGPVTSTLIGASEAPDVTFHFGGIAMTNTFAEMGALLDLAPLLQRYGHLLPNMYDWLDDLVHYPGNIRPDGRMYSMSSRRTEVMQQNVFIREDWLNQLGLPVPTTLQEFENALVAFRDNAPALLGADADMMIPMFFAEDALWYVRSIAESFIPDSISERDWFVYGFDDRRFMHHDAAKEATRLANRWFHEGLLWQDFAYEDTQILHDMVRLGVVGAVMGNWDWPFRGGGDQWTTTMREHRGDQATFVAHHPFPNDVGNHVLFGFPASDRQIVLPHTNRNPLASLLYIDMVSSQEVRDFMAFGLEGVHHVVEPGGARRITAAADQPDNFIFAAVHNFDIQFVSNGFDLGDPVLTASTLALAYPGIEPEAVIHARETALAATRVWPTLAIRPRAAEEGMNEPLLQFRNVVMHNAVTAPPAQFEAVWTEMYEQYMAMGGRAIIEERRQAWIETFGDVDFSPAWPGW